MYLNFTSLSLTSRNDFLIGDIHSQLGNLEMMIADEPANQRASLNELNILKDLIQAKLAGLDQTMTLQQLHSINAALPIILRNPGKTLMDNIRAIGADIQVNRITCWTWILHSQSYAQAITYTIIITTVAAAGITSVLVHAINRDIHRRHLAVQRSLQTEVENRTEQLQIANEQLKLHDKMQQEFINVAAHELRTPIQPILSLTQILHSKINDSQQQESLGIIIRNAKRLKKLSDELLYVTRLETHALELKKEQFDLNEVILHAIDDVVLSKEFSKKNPKLLYEPREILLKADKSRIAEVISNLLSIAIKFTPEGTITISVEKDETKNWVVVSVKDTGQGIDASIMPRLFTKFASKSYQGTGLGLFIAKSIVETHMGKIWGKNNIDGIGATFSFSLPSI